MNSDNITFSDLCLLGSNPFKNIQQFQAVGIHRAELMMDGFFWDDFASQKNQFIEKISQYDIMYSLHAPCWDVNLSCEMRLLREASLKIALAAVDFAAGSDCEYLVIHTGFCQSPAFERKRGREYSYDALQTICRRARESGVKIGIENVGYQGTSLYTYDEFVHLLDDFGDEAGFVLDVGHAVLNGIDPVVLLRDIKGRLFGMHLHDNNGQADQHLPLGDGIICWEQLLAEISQVQHSGSLVLEYACGTPIERLIETKNYLRRL